jgi:hypothetical protein
VTGVSTSAAAAAAVRSFLFRVIPASMQKIGTVRKQLDLLARPVR